MNVKQLIEKYKELENGSFDIGALVVCQLILKDLEQLDEPQKVVVPQFVADVIESAREHSPELEDALHYTWGNGTKEFTEWYKKKSNRDLFARAWLDGYEVEEKRYLVKIKNLNALFCYLAHSDHGDYWSLTCSKMNGFSTKHTRKQLEEAGFGWVFNCPGIEVLEVE